MGVHGATAAAARVDRGGAEYGHDRTQRRSPRRRRRAIQRSRGADRGVERECGQHDGVFESAGHHRGHRAGERRNRARAEEALRQQQLESAPAQRPVAVSAARRGGDGVHDRVAPRLSHPVRPARKDQLREDGKDRAAHPPGELGPCERRVAAERTGRSDDHAVKNRFRFTRETQRHRKELSNATAAKSAKHAKKPRATGHSVFSLWLCASVVKFRDRDRSVTARYPMRIGVVVTVAAVLVSSMAEARVIKRRVERREVVLDGAPFGAAGPYEKLVGKVDFGLDPNAPANDAIVDLRLAPRNARGDVEASADFYLLKPVDPRRGNGRLFYEVGNRGGKSILVTFQKASPSTDPKTAAEFGDGALMRQGFTLLWMGWQWDVPVREGTMRMSMPIASESGRKITGLVRGNFILNERAQTASVADRNHQAYAVVDPDSAEHVMTVRDD